MNIIYCPSWDWTYNGFMSLVGIYPKNHMWCNTYFDIVIVYVFTLKIKVVYDGLSFSFLFILVNY